MNSDIVERLRDAGTDCDWNGVDGGIQKDPLLHEAADEITKLRAALPTEAQPEVTGAVGAWRIVDKHDHHTGLYSPVCGDLPNWAKEELSRYEITPLYPPSAIEGYAQELAKRLVREKLEEALNLAQTIKVPERNGFNQAGLHAWDMAVAEYWKAIRALINT